MRSGSASSSNQAWLRFVSPDQPELPPVRWAHSDLLLTGWFQVLPYQTTALDLASAGSRTLPTMFFCPAALQPAVAWETPSNTEKGTTVTDPSAPRMLIYTPPTCLDCHALKRWLAEQEISHKSATSPTHGSPRKPRRARVSGWLPSASSVPRSSTAHSRPEARPDQGALAE